MCFRLLVLHCFFVLLSSLLLTLRLIPGCLAWIHHVSCYVLTTCHFSVIDTHGGLFIQYCSVTPVG